MAAEEREMKRLLQEKAKKKLEKIKLEKLRLKKIQEQDRKLEAEKKRQQQQQQKALKMKKSKNHFKSRRMKQRKLRENAIRNASLQQQDQSRSSFHPMSPLNVSVHRDEEDSNGTQRQLRGRKYLHALIMKHSVKEHRGPINSTYASGNRLMSSRNKHIASPQEEIAEEEDSDEELELPEGVPQIIATVYRELKKFENRPKTCRVSHSNELLEWGDLRGSISQRNATRFRYLHLRQQICNEGEWSEGLCHGEGLNIKCEGEASLPR